MKTQYVRGEVLRAPVEGSRVIRFRASTPRMDRHGTKIMPQGIRTDNYDKNPVFLWGHDGYGGFLGGPDMCSVIGRTISHSQSEQSFDIDVEFASRDVSETADQAFKLVKSGFLNAVSIGFNPIRWRDEQSENSQGRITRVFEEVELLEVSLVPIPSNPDAVKLSRHMFGDDTVDVDQLRAIDVFLRAGKVLSKANKEKLKKANALIGDAVGQLGEVIASQPDEDELTALEKLDQLTNPLLGSTEEKKAPRGAEAEDVQGVQAAAYARAATAAVSSVLFQRAILSASRKPAGK